MSEIIEPEYYNTTYVLYENNDMVANNEEPPKQVVEEVSSEQVAKQPRRPKKQEDQESLYDEDLYSLPKGAKASDTSEPSSEMDQRLSILQKSTKGRQYNVWDQTTLNTQCYYF